MNAHRFVCPCCMFRRVEVRMSAKGAPYLTCGMCSTRFFTRGEELGLHNLVATLRLLDAEENRKWVAAQGFAAAENPLGVADLVKPVEAASTRTAADSPAERQPKAVSG